jgi:hypothetical protein
MKSYQFLYSEPIRRYQAMVITFCLFALLIIIPSLPFYNKIEPLLILVFFALPVSVGFLFYFYFIRSEIPCQVTTTPTSLLIELTKTDLFVKNKELLVPLESIKTVKEDIMPNKNLTAFYSIHFIKNRTSIRLTQVNSISKEDLSAFSNAINAQVDHFNSTMKDTLQSKQIRVKKGSNINSWWAKLFTGVIYFSLLLFTLIWIADSEDISWSTALKFYGFCFLWLISFHNRVKE